jgi:hypothetical protein
MTPEGKVKKAFRETAREFGLAYINLIDTGDDGNPDRLALPRGGVPAFIEFKRRVGGVLSPEQKKKIKKYRGLGYRVFVIDTEEDARALAWTLCRIGGWDKCDEDELKKSWRKQFKPR